MRKKGLKQQNNIYIKRRVEIIEYTFIIFISVSTNAYQCLVLSVWRIT